MPSISDVLLDVPDADSHAPIPGSIAIIGGGNMARSLIGGLVALGMPASRIVVSEPHTDLRDALVHDFGVCTHADNNDATTAADVWVLAVKPQVLRAVCEALSAQAQERRPLVVSIAAGITTQQIESWLGGGIAIVRCMPNTPALLGAAATGMFANAHTSIPQRERAQRLMDAVGISVWIDDEAQMNTITATSGSAPAYVFLLLEAMQAAAEAQGLPADTARALLTQSVLGAARMLTESGESAQVLRQRVTSPGGTTQAAIAVFEAGGFGALVGAAIAAANARGAQLAAETEKGSE